MEFELECNGCCVKKLPGKVYTLLEFIPYSHMASWSAMLDGTYRANLKERHSRTVEGS